jgi:hypothetical protein
MLEGAAMSRRDRTTPAAASATLAPGQTNLDFLGGSFALNERARISGIVSVGVSLVLLVLATLVGVSSSARSGQLADQLASTSENVSRLSVQLGELSNTGGVGEQQLKARLNLLTAQLTAAEASQLDVLRIANDLSAAVGVNGQIILISLSRDESGVQKLTANVALGSFENLTALSAGLAQQLWYLQSPSVNWTSGGERGLVVVSIEAPVDPAFASGRAADLIAQYGLTQGGQ